MAKLVADHQIAEMSGGDDYSIGEISSLVFKAYRGLGRPWGLAEEAGRAVIWLLERGLPGPDLFARLIQGFDGKAWQESSLSDLSRPWSARNGLLCPVIAGTILCDTPDLLKEANGIDIHHLAAPLIILPFVVTAARKTGAAFAVEWDHARIVCSADGHRVEAGATDVDENELSLGGAETCADVRISTTISAEDMSRPIWTRARCSQDTIRILEHFAHRTYVPETELSRLKGAGAGLTDND